MRISFLLLLFLPLTTLAQLRIADVFSDNMVLQREKPIHVWGTYAPGKSITVLFANESRSAIVQTDSLWSVEFNKKDASTSAYEIIVSSDQYTIQLKNILIGDVWLCIGQSNMEWPMKKEMHFNDEIESSNQPLLRLYNPTYAGKNIFGTEFPDSIIEQLNSDDFYQGQWQNCDSNSFKDMSAVGYYFGKNIISEMNVPIGLINMSIGGAPIETFINPEAMKSNAQFRAKVNGNWLTNDALPVWVRERGKQNIGSDSVNNNHPFKPGYAFQNGINGITPFPIKGILWYQGESNAQEADRVYEYGALMKLMIDDYRKQWSQIDLPFYFVQLSSIDTTHYKGQLWPMFRDEQRKSLAKIDFSGMAVCSDVGSKDDVHPRNKKIVGERLARWALSKTYKKDIFPSGPLPLSAKYEEGKVVIAFQYGAAGLKSSDGNKVKGFSIDGKSEINAEIVNDTIVLFVNEKPEYIYYGWQPYSNANLVNSEVLPASTFKIAIQ